MNRLEILVINRLSKNDGVFTSYVDIPSVINFLARTNYATRFSIVARKGNRSIFLEKLDPSTLSKQLLAFQNQP